MSLRLLSRLLSANLLIALLAWGCASAQPPGRSLRPTGIVLSSAEVVRAAEIPQSQPSSMPTSQPSAEQRLAELRRLILAELEAPEMERARVSLLVAPAGGGEPLFELDADAHRVPASNAKLLTSVAALKSLPGRHRFVTALYQRGTRLYVHGNGDPALRGREINALGRQLRARGVRRITGVVVDDSYYGRRRLAPGFSDFSEGAYYRPTSGALNVNGNAVTIKVSASPKRRRPRIDVYPRSDYVKVRKLVRYLPRRSRRGTRIKVNVRPRGSIMWVTVSGVMQRGDRPWRTRRAVYDPGLATGWAVRRGLLNAGVEVSGSVWRGRRPRSARLVLRRVRSLGAVLSRVNGVSDNLAAENLVRAMGSLGDGRPAGSWKRGLEQLHVALKEMGLTDFDLGNGSGLHRRSWVTARTMVALLLGVWADPALRERLVPTLAVAGRRGTLAPRMRGTAAEGVVAAKTGTLAGALALSGYVSPDGDAPLAFSLLVNGRSDRAVRERMDRVAVLLARYALGQPLEEAEPSSLPASAPASQPLLDDEEGEESEDSEQDGEATPAAPGPASR